MFQYITGWFSCSWNCSKGNEGLHHMATSFTSWWCRKVRNGGYSRKKREKKRWSGEVEGGRGRKRETLTGGDCPIIPFEDMPTLPWNLPYGPIPWYFHHLPVTTKLESKSLAHGTSEHVPEPNHCNSDTVAFIACWYFFSNTLSKGLFFPPCGGYF